MARPLPQNYPPTWAPRSARRRPGCVRGLVMWPLSSPRWPSGCEPRPPRSQPTGMPGGRYGPSCGSATSRRAPCQPTPLRPSAGADAPWSGHVPARAGRSLGRRAGQYLEETTSPRNYRAIDDGVFSGLAASKPSIYPIYWSRPQMQAREDDRMVAVRRFLNSFWKHESEGRVWFDPDRDTAYPDRVRRRAPGPVPGGLSAHTDSGSVERWLLPAYQQRVPARLRR